MAFSMYLMRCISAVFWQSKQELDLFSTGTETEHNTEISGFVLHMSWENKAQLGFFSQQDIGIRKTTVLWK